MEKWQKFLYNLFEGVVWVLRGWEPLMDMSQLEKYIQLNAQQMVRCNGVKRKSAASVLAVHATQWLNLANEDHPQWGEIFRLLDRALEILYGDDDEGDSPVSHNPGEPLPPHGGLQVEVLETLREALRELLPLVDSKELIRIRNPKRNLRLESIIKVFFIVS